MNIFLSFFVCLDVSQIQIFDTDYVNKKGEHTFFDIDFSYLDHLYTNMIIGMELFIHLSYNH